VDGASDVSTRGPVDGPCWRSWKLRRGFSTGSTPDSAPVMPAKPIVGVRRSGTGLPHRTSLQAICEAGLVPFLDFSAAFDFEKEDCVSGGFPCCQLGGKSSCFSLAKCLADSYSLNIPNVPPHTRRMPKLKAMTTAHRRQVLPNAAKRPQATIPDSTTSLLADWRGRPGTGNLTLQVPNHTARSTRPTRGRELVDSSHLPR
jgi:hypothetical protein